MCHYNFSANLEFLRLTFVGDNRVIQNSNENSRMLEKGHVSTHDVLMIMQ
jgi:hypothetical protein